jgi:hypothetical protein
MSAAEDTLRVAKPVSLAEGEVVLLLAGTADDGAGPCYTPPTDFTELFDYGDATVDTRIWAAWKYASASEPDSYFVASSCGGDNFCMFAYRITGVTSIATRAFDPGTKSSINTTDSLTVTGITTYLDSSLALCLYSFDGGDGDPFSVKASTSTWSEEDQLVSGTSTTTDVGLFFATKSMPTLGATGICKVDAAVADGQVGTIIAIHGSSTLDPDWGGKEVYQSPDSMAATHARSSDPTYNYGAYTWTASAPGTSVNTRNMWYRPVNDPRTGGYTQDSVKLHFYNDPGNSTPFTDGTDSAFLTLFILKKLFGEGDNATGAIAGTGECNWTYAESSSVAWATAGALGSGDRYGPLDSFAVTKAWTDASSTDSEEVILTIRGDGAIDSLFTYGAWVGFTSGVSSPPTGMWFFFSDDWTTALQRPWIEGWEHSAGVASAIPVRRLRNEKMGK